MIDGFDATLWLADEKFKRFEIRSSLWRFEILAKDFRFECKVLFVICLLDGDGDARAHIGIPYPIS